MSRNKLKAGLVAGFFFLLLFQISAGEFTARAYYISPSGQFTEKPAFNLSAENLKQLELLVTRKHAYQKVSDSHWNEQVTVLNEIPEKGYIPVLCFHKIGTAQRYALTPERLVFLLQFLKKNQFYPVSDRDFLTSDFSEVPPGFHPIVLGSDDASYGNIIFKSENDDVHSPLTGVENSWTLSENSLASILINELDFNRYKHYPFTFYISFDGIPFRQTGGYPSGVQPYILNPVVDYKIKWAFEQFYLGHHSYNHPVTSNLTADEFLNEIILSFQTFESILGKDKARLINTMAYPYGCGDLNPELEKELRQYRYEDEALLGAFDFDGYFSSPPYTRNFNNFEVSRLGVDNKNFSQVLGFLKDLKMAEVRRIFLADTTLDKFRKIMNGFPDLHSGDLIYITGSEE